MTEADAHLHPLLRHHLVNTLGWRSLRPLQHQAIPRVLRGDHVLILAPTAGGKTEAAIFPLISRMLAEGWTGTSILYLCPLKALLNNLEPRLVEYFGMVGGQAALWHGDVAAGARDRVRRGLPACILTTPESVESMLVSTRRENRTILQGLRAVVVDEIHAFAGDDRGTHLLCLLERLAGMVTHRMQRVGLSATVGNPEALLSWLTCGREPDRQSIVSVPPALVETEVTLDYVGHLDNAALVVSRLFADRKRLVFCDSRRRVEELTHLLRSRQVEAYACHSSLSVENRRKAEQAFSAGRECVIVATSTLELGVDVGDLDHVIQIDAPGSVASFLQRLGRTGRRAGSVRNCLFLGTSPASLLQAAAIVQLWERGFVEPVVPPRTPYHLAAHQALTLCLQHGRLSAARFLGEIQAVPGIRDLPTEDLQALLQHLVEREFLIRDGPFLILGPATERRFGRRHFTALLSVFSSAESLEVREGQRCLGYVDWLSLAVPAGRERAPLILGGASWDITEIDWPARTVRVVRSQDHGQTRWHGSALGLAHHLAQTIREILVAEDVSPRWTSRASEEIRRQRLDLGESARRVGGWYVALPSGDYILPTFLGTSLNQLMALVLAQATGLHVVADDYALRFHLGKSRVDFSTWPTRDWPSLVEQVVAQNPDMSESLKFHPCLPSHLAAKAILGKIGPLPEGIAFLNTWRPPTATFEAIPPIPPIG